MTTSPRALAAGSPTPELEQQGQHTRESLGATFSDPVRNFADMLPLPPASPYPNGEAGGSGNMIGANAANAMSTPAPTADAANQSRTRIGALLQPQQRQLDRASPPRAPLPTPTAMHSTVMPDHDEQNHINLEKSHKI